MKWIRPLFGLIILLSAVLSGFFLWNLLDEKPQSDQAQLNLLFNDATGLEIGASLRYRGVRVGEVNAIRLSGSSELALVSCSLSSAAFAQLHTDTRFWIVRPRFKGVSQGASGLETLIKESYVTYAHSSELSPKLTAGAQLIGESTPPLLNNGSLLERKSPGDLILHLHIAQRSELHNHSQVTHRGIVVGEIEQLQIREDLQAVKIRARIYKNYRSLVTDQTLFWAAKTEVDMGWLRGLKVNDLNALLSGVHLSFWTPPDAASSPVSDNTHFVATIGRPSEVIWPPVQIPSHKNATANPGNGTHSGDPLQQRVVMIHYSYEEDDGWIFDDHYSAKAPGILIHTQSGRWVVVTTRSTVDPLWIDSESTPEISSENLRVELSNGQIFQAGRIWTAPDGEDLAVLIIHNPNSSFPFDKLDGEISFGQPTKAHDSLQQFGFDSNLKWLRSSLSIGEAGEFADQSLQLSSVLLTKSKIIGLVGTDGPFSLGQANKRHYVSLQKLPSTWRPAHNAANQQDQGK